MAITRLNARLSQAGQVLGLGDDPALAGPACECGVEELANRRAPFSR